MPLPTILSAILGLSTPWKVTNLSFSNNYKRLEISVDFSQEDNPACQQCGALDQCTEKESCSWFNKDFFSYETYLHSRSPRNPCCSTGGKIIPPWVQKGSKFVAI